MPVSLQIPPFFFFPRYQILDFNSKAQNSNTYKFNTTSKSRFCSYWASSSTDTNQYRALQPKCIYIVNPAPRILELMYRKSLLLIKKNKRLCKCGLTEGWGPFAGLFCFVCIFVAGNSRPNQEPKQPLPWLKHSHDNFSFGSTHLLGSLSQFYQTLCL